ncbi:MAG: tetratricopeptide repeat protein [Verrucomicrobiota bacterium]
MDNTVTTYPEITLKDLDPRLRKQVEKAAKSIGQNASYAVDICTNILQQHPGCLEIRQLLRKAQMQQAGKPSSLGKLFGSVTSAPFALKATSLIKKDAKAALEGAEKVLSGDPRNASGHKMLGQAAEAMELWQTAAFAYEHAAKFDPKSLENKLAYGNALNESGKPEEAIRVAGEILKDNPGNDQAQELVKRASVKESMERGKWDDDSADFRDKLADEEKSVELEQRSRVVNDEDTLQRLLEKNLKLLEKEPENMNLYREIINGYRTLEDFDTALKYLAQAREQPTGRGDTTLERLFGELTLQSMLKKITGVEAQLAEKPGDATLTTELDGLKKAEHDFRLNTARETVEKYPNDYAARFEYGKLLYEDGQGDDAIQQFQQARRNPKVRTIAILYLGRALNATGKSDMAIEQLKTAKDDVIGMTELKKEIIYDLALAYGENGDEERSIEELKEIYQDDIGYKDVSDRINTFYEKKKSS